VKDAVCLLAPRWHDLFEAAEHVNVLALKKGGAGYEKNQVTGEARKNYFITR